MANSVIKSCFRLVSSLSLVTATSLVISAAQPAQKAVAQFAATTPVRSMVQPVQNAQFAAITPVESMVQPAQGGIAQVPGNIISIGIATGVYNIPPDNFVVFENFEVPESFLRLTGGSVKQCESPDGYSVEPDDCKDPNSSRHGFGYSPEFGSVDNPNIDNPPTIAHCTRDPDGNGLLFDTGEKIKCFRPDDSYVSEEVSCYGDADGPTQLRGNGVPKRITCETNGHIVGEYWGNNPLSLPVNVNPISIQQLLNF
jgi:hypothetical protein